jgi:hypothetical protein
MKSHPLSGRWRDGVDLINDMASTRNFNDATDETASMSSIDEWYHYVTIKQFINSDECINDSLGKPRYYCEN